MKCRSASWHPCRDIFNVASDLGTQIVSGGDLRPVNSFFKIQPIGTGWPLPSCPVIERGDKASAEGDGPAQARLLDGGSFVLGNELQQSCPQDQALGITLPAQALIGAGRRILDESGDDLEDILPRVGSGARCLSWRKTTVQAAREHLKHVFDKLPEGPVRRLAKQGGVRGDSQEHPLGPM